GGAQWACAGAGQALWFTQRREGRERGKGCCHRSSPAGGGGPDEVWWWGISGGDHPRRLTPLHHALRARSPSPRRGGSRWTGTWRLMLLHYCRPWLLLLHKGNEDQLRPGEAGGEPGEAWARSRGGRRGAERPLPRTARRSFRLWRGPVGVDRPAEGRGGGVRLGGAGGDGSEGDLASKGNEE